jgi:alkanesulfonate monooxygenase SsuD/methylene tetrahydromethanopterin reductase-like flavin-dependent oxidoreductase (luciferase family)
MREVAQQAEAIGLNAVFVPEHTGFDLADGSHTKVWDGWALLPALAVVTSKVALGPFVAVPSVRHPIALARMASVVDEVNGGRLILALGSSGADSSERAWRVLGIPNVRLYARFEEAVMILVPLLREGAVDFAGQYFTARAARLGPPGPRGGRIPIWIAAKGPRMTRLAARWADAINFNGHLTSPEDARTLVAGFADACREVGRDPASVGRTGYALVSFTAPESDPAGVAFGALRGSPAELAAQLHAFHRAGIDHVSLDINGGDRPERQGAFPITTTRGLEQMARVLEALRELES